MIRVPLPSWEDHKMVEWYKVLIIWENDQKNNDRINIGSWSLEHQTKHQVTTTLEHWLSDKHAPSGKVWDAYGLQCKLRGQNCKLQFHEKTLIKNVTEVLLLKFLQSFHFLLLILSFICQQLFQSFGSADLGWAGRVSHKQPHKSLKYTSMNNEHGWKHSFRTLVLAEAPIGCTGTGQQLPTVWGFSWKNKLRWH